eukprot:scaffold31181_cov92-Amphora_coffeaeformis.AAC.1
MSAKPSSLFATFSSFYVMVKQIRLLRRRQSPSSMMYFAELWLPLSVTTSSKPRTITSPGHETPLASGVSTN